MTKTAQIIVALTFTVLWLMVFGLPLAFISSADDNYLGRIVFEWIRMAPFLILFLLNAFVLVPKLFKKGKYWSYLAIALLASIATAQITDARIIGSWKIGELELVSPGGHPGNRPPRPEDRLEAPPMNRPQRPFRNPPPQKPAPKPLPLQLASNLLIAVLMLGFYNAVQTLLGLEEAKRRAVQLEKQQLQTELAFLKHQISPHFFMNTLNNIHALVDINGDDAKTSIIRLSRMMRYLLYESDNGMTTLKKELDFINSFLELMRLRYPEKKVSIIADLPELSQDLEIPAFLFVSYIENAFKHGINPKGQSRIHLSMQLNDNELRFSITNSNHPVVSPIEPHASGVGLNNSRQRLDLLFKGNYQLYEGVREEMYLVELKLSKHALANTHR